MRIFSLLTAGIFALALYYLVIKRDEFTALVRGAPENVEQQESVEAPIVPEIGDRPVSVIAIESRASEIETGALLRGQTEAARFVDVKSETSGLVISEPLRKGTMVEEGQLVCELDPGTRLAALDEARARLNEAEIAARAANQLATEGFGSELRRTSSLAALQSATAIVKRAEQDIARLRIRAPFNGLLESDAAELGSLLQPGGLCATIIQLDPIRIVGFITEAEVDRVKVGNFATATLSSGRKVTGNLTFVSKSADPTTRTFRLEVTVGNADYSIRDGSSAEIFIAAEKRPAHFLPQSALTLNDRGEIGVRLVIDGQARFSPIRIVRDTSDGIWVEGLDEHVSVIVVGQEYVVDGSAIEVTYMGESR